MTAERGHDSFTSEDGDAEVTEPAAATPTGGSGVEEAERVKCILEAQGRQNRGNQESSESIWRNQPVGVRENTT